MIRAFEVGGDANLEEFGRLLWQQRIPHVIRADGAVQLVLVASPDQVREALSLYRAWQQGEIRPEPGSDTSLADFVNAGVAGRGLGSAFLRSPFTLVLVASCSVIFLLTYVMGNTELFRALLFPAFARGGVLDLSQVASSMTPALFLRMFTPILLHGGWLHIIFNMLWTWEFGRCIEARQRWWVMLLVIMGIAFVANWAQYIQQGSNSFVGISGVVAGLMGYIAMWKIIDPEEGIWLPGSILLYMLVMIVVMAVIDLDFIADTAHVAGLIAGALIGLFMAAGSRLSRERRR